MLAPKHILITGASSGIGAALAELYAAPGIRLSLHGRNAERLAVVAEKVKARGALCEIQVGDVTDTDAMAAWIAGCDRTQPIDLLIANAGISAGTGGVRESVAQLRAIFATNLTGVLNTVQPALPLMVRRRRGQIVLMSSLASFRGFAGAPAYCSSKAAVRVYGEALRGAMAKQGVEVNVICPGFIKTPMTDVNPFHMPMIMDADRAAHIIRDGLQRNRARIAFPWQLYVAVRLLTALPQAFLDRIGTILPAKPGIKSPD